MGDEFGVAPPGFRLPAHTRPGAVRLQVSDLGRSVAWYEQVIGLRARDAGPGTATLAAGDDDSPIVVLRERAGARPAPHHGRLGLYHFAILLPDRGALGRFLLHLNAAGTAAGAADHLVSEALYLHDPDGLGVEVYADRPRVEWQSRGRELLMRSDPLDARSLAAAGGGEPWAGAPAGTVIGHVHLHVGSLSEAEAFYHRALGLDKVVWSYPGALFLSAGGYHHHLGVNTWAGAAPRAAEDEARLLEWELRVGGEEVVREVASSVEGEGYEVRWEGGEGVMEDPWGVRVRVG
jgi:catechol 2,3-dioxygenase